MDINLNSGLREPLTAARISILALTPLILLKGNEYTKTTNNAKQLLCYFHNSDQDNAVILLGWPLFFFMFFDSKVKKTSLEDSLAPGKKDFYGMIVYLYY